MAMTHTEYARKQRSWKKSQGICLDCSAPREFGKSRCSLHLQELAKAAKARRNASKKPPQKRGPKLKGKVKFWAYILPETREKILAAKVGKETPGQALDRLI